MRGTPRALQGGGVRGGGALSWALREPLSVSWAEGSAVMRATPSGAVLRGQEPDSWGP